MNTERWHRDTFNNRVDLIRRPGESTVDAVWRMRSAEAARKVVDIGINGRRGLRVLEVARLVNQVRGVCSNMANDVTEAVWMVIRIGNMCNHGQEYEAAYSNFVGMLEAIKSGDDDAMQACIGHIEAIEQELKEHGAATDR